MKEFFKKNGLKIASWTVTGAGVVLGIVESCIKDKQDENRIKEMVNKVLKDQMEGK